MDSKELKPTFVIAGGQGELTSPGLRLEKQDSSPVREIVVQADIDADKRSILFRPAGRKAGSGERRRALKAEKPSLQMLAYAPAPRLIEAPFDAVMGGERRDIIAEEQDAPAFVPRARPGATVLTAWLGDRSISDFRPQKHDWADDPLPPSAK